MWFFKSVLNDSLEREFLARQSSIDDPNKQITDSLRISDTDNSLNCDHCEKTYKTNTGLQKHTASKHKSNNSEKKNYLRDDNSYEEYNTPNNEKAVSTLT